MHYRTKRNFYELLTVQMKDKSDITFYLCKTIVDK